MRGDFSRPTPVRAPPRPKATVSSSSSASPVRVWPQAIGDGDFSVVYTRDPQGSITSIIIGPGDDYQALINQAKR